MSHDAAHAWYQLSWVDWVSVGGLPLALIGLYLTWVQAKNAAKAAEAAREAVLETEHRIRINQLMVLIPQLRWTVSELESAISSYNSSQVRRQLESWRWQASNIYGMLEAVAPAEARTLRILQQSVGLARSAGAALIAKPGTEEALRNDFSKVRAAIVLACDDLNMWLGRSSTQAQNGTASND